MEKLLPQCHTARKSRHSSMTHNKFLKVCWKHNGLKVKQYICRLYTEDQSQGTKAIYKTLRVTCAEWSEEDLLLQIQATRHRRGCPQQGYQLSVHFPFPLERKPLPANTRRISLTSCLRGWTDQHNHFPIWRASESPKGLVKTRAAGPHASGCGTGLRICISYTFPHDS